MAEETSEDPRPPASAPPFSLEKYASLYSGNTLIQRLVRLLQEESLSSPLETALVLLTALTTQTYQTSLYSHLFTKFSFLGNPDEGWIANAEAQRKKEILQLREKLTAAKERSSDEVIDVYLDVGRFNCKLGDLGEACKNFVSAIERASGMKLVQCQLNLGRVYLDHRDPQRALSTCLEILIPDGASSQERKIIEAKKNFLTGVANMCLARWRDAAENLLSLEYSQTFFPELGSKRDIVLYGFFCMIASFQRSEVHHTLFGDMYPGFKRMLGTEVEIQNMALNFHHMHFAQFYQTLRSYHPLIKSDVYLSGIEKPLLSTIRERTILQYFVPFSSLRLSLMSCIFDTPMDKLEAELLGLISEKKLSARIDREKMTLVAYSPSLKADLIQKTLDLGSSFQADAMAALFHVNATKAHLMVGDERLPRMGMSQKQKGKKEVGW